MTDENKLHYKILKVLKEESKSNGEYINPNFLYEISSLLWGYYGITDKDVNQWINDMLSR